MRLVKCEVNISRNCNSPSAIRFCIINRGQRCWRIPWKLTKISLFFAMERELSCSPFLFKLYIIIWSYINYIQIIEIILFPFTGNISGIWYNDGSMCTINVIIIVVAGDERITTKHVSKIWEMRMWKLWNIKLQGNTVELPIKCLKMFHITYTVWTLKVIRYSCSLMCQNSFYNIWNVRYKCKK